MHCSFIAGLVQEQAGEMEETKEGGTGEDEEDSRGRRLQARRRSGAADAASDFHRRRFLRFGGGLGSGVPPRFCI